MSEGRDLSNGQFVKGFRGGPGRQKGSRNKLAEQFYEDLYAEWNKRGAEVLEHMSGKDLARLVAFSMPKDFNINPDSISSLSAEDLGTFLFNLKQSIIAAGGDALQLAGTEVQLPGATESSD